MLPFDPPLSAQEVGAALQSVTISATLKPGGQGAVFKCVDGKRQVGLLKVYGKQTEVVRVEHEIKKLQAINSPQVVRLLDHGTLTVRHDAHVFSVVEYVEGSDLTHPAGLWDEARTRRLLHDVSRGIEAMWAKRVVHRDIKPANVMQRVAGGFTIIDLGLAKHLDEKTVTMIGRTCGTIGYMSPEQAQGRRGLTFRSDLYALGVLAYEVVAGVHPFARNQAAMAAGARAALLPLTKVTGPVRALIDSLLQPDAMSRPASCSEVYNVCGGP